MTIGSGGINSGPSRVGISENFIREHSSICQREQHIQTTNVIETRALKCGKNIYGI